jgi:translation initiation factor IF-3
MEGIQRDLEGMAQIEREPIMEGRNIIMVVSLSSSGAKKKKE